MLLLNDVLWRDITNLLIFESSMIGKYSRGYGCYRKDILYMNPSQECQGSNLSECYVQINDIFFSQELKNILSTFDLAEKI